MKKSFLPLIGATFFAASTFPASAQSWSLTGNSGTSASTNFLGTTDAKALVLRTNNKERLRITSGGKIGVGTPTPNARFNVAAGNNVTLRKTDSFLLGALSSFNLAFDYNDIHARNNGAGSTLYLNFWGGDTWIGSHGKSDAPSIYVGKDGSAAIGDTIRQPGFA